MPEYQAATVGSVARSVSETHERTRDTLIFLNTSDIERGKILHRRYSRVADMPGQAKKSVCSDDILFSEIRPANGRWALVHEASDDFIVSTKLMVIRADPERVLPRYLYMFLTSARTTDWLQTLAESRSGTFPQITFDQVSELDLPLPSIDEQTRIVATLGSLDDKITSNERAIDAAYRSLDATAETFNGDLPPIALGDIAIATRATADPSSFGGELVDHFSLPAFDDGVWPDRVPAESIMSNKLLVERPSILVSRLNPRINRTWWAVPTAGVTALASTEFTCLSSTTAVDLAALWFVLRQESFMSELKKRVTGTSGSHQRIRPADLLTIEVGDVRLLPEKTKALALELLTVIHQRRSESRKLASLRNFLLPHLLLGRMRVDQDAVGASE